MPSPDATNPLAYLDAGTLLRVIGDDEVWKLVEYALMKRQRWDKSSLTSSGRFETGLRTSVVRIETTSAESSKP